MEQRCAGPEPLRSSRRREYAELFKASLLLITFISGPCGEREAVSSQRPRVWEAGGQARRAGAPWGPVGRLWAGWQVPCQPVRAAQPVAFPRERAQSTGFP